MKYYKLLTFVVMLFAAIGAKAQSNGDKLFLEGQTLQKTMTVASQNAAIKKFQAAKVVYTSSEKKQMCDNQVAICRSNIRSLSDLRPKKKKETTQVKEEAPKEEEAPAPVKRTDVELSLSETRLDFKYKPKDGATQSVRVKCNYDDWFVASKPDWLDVYTTKEKISVEAQENKTEEDRSGLIVIKCEDTEVNLIVNQDGEKSVDKIVSGVKSLFSKKKK